MSDHITVSEDDRNVEAYCHWCGVTKAFPNKGLGRAFLAAWRTQHQNQHGEDA